MSFHHLLHTSLPLPTSLLVCMCVCSQIIFLMKSSGNEAKHIRWMDCLTNRIKPVNWMHIVMANCYSIIKWRCWRGWGRSEVAHAAPTWEQTGMTNKWERNPQASLSLSPTQAPNNHFLIPNALPACHFFPSLPTWGNFISLFCLITSNTLSISPNYDSILNIVSPKGGLWIEPLKSCLLPWTLVYNKNRCHSKNMSPKGSPTPKLSLI